MKNLKELLLIASLLAIASSQVGMTSCINPEADGADCTQDTDCIGKRCVNIDAGSKIGVCASVCSDPNGDINTECISGFYCGLALNGERDNSEAYCLEVISCTGSDQCRDGQICESNSCVDDLTCGDDTGCAMGMVCRNGGCIPNNCTRDTDCAAYETCNTPTASCVGKPCTDDPTVCTDAAQCDNGVCVKL